MDSRIKEPPTSSQRLTSAEPVSGQSERVLAAGDHVVLGISPFNAYFSEERIYELVEWGHRSFRAMHLFVPDEPSTYTLQAIGYAKDKARKKARRQANYLLNKINRALDRVDLTGTAKSDIVLTWQKLSSNKRFLTMLEEAKHIYAADGEFQTDCRTEVLRILKHQSPPDQRISPDALDLATEYFLCEMPLFLDSASILGQATSVFAYRECIPLLRKLYSDEYQFAVSPQQGFAVVKCSTESEVAALQGMFI